MKNASKYIDISARKQPSAKGGGGTSVVIFTLDLAMFKNSFSETLSEGR